MVGQVGSGSWAEELDIGRSLAAAAGEVAAHTMSERDQDVTSRAHEDMTQWSDHESVAGAAHLVIPVGLGGRLLVAAAAVGLRRRLTLRVAAAAAAVTGLRAVEIALLVEKCLSGQSNQE